ncbi:MAG: monovalent cation/H+ antiporter subunit D family protein, partial [Deltaproteobacteria bacterium]|nr:monovalent cation/H+ antiporter subunit D family protein [Deltaproteobacteria bacterium]
GLGRRMPWTMGAFLVGSLSVIGLPPAGGFLSKWWLLIGTLEAGQIGFLAVLLVSSLLNAAYFLPIVYNAFFAAPSAPFPEHAGEAPAWCLAPIMVVALCSLMLFFHPGPFADLARLAVAQITGG